MWLRQSDTTNTFHFLTQQFVKYRIHDYARPLIHLHQSASKNINKKTKISFSSLPFLITINLVFTFWYQSLLIQFLHFDTSQFNPYINSLIEIETQIVFWPNQNYMTQWLTLFQTIKYSNLQKKCFKMQNHTQLKLSPLYLGLCVGLNKGHMRYFLAMVLRSQNCCVKVVSEALY